MHPELLVRKRIWLMTLVLTGLFLLAAARIAVLTTSEAASLTERGIRQWTKAGIVTARRGTITDRKGRTLAISATAYIVTADPRLVSDTERQYRAGAEHQQRDGTKTIAGQDKGVDYLKAAGQPRDGRCPASAAVRRAGGQRLEGAVL